MKSIDLIPSRLDITLKQMIFNCLWKKLGLIEEITKEIR